MELPSPPMLSITPFSLLITMAATAPAACATRVLSAKLTPAPRLNTTTLPSASSGFSRSLSPYSGSAMKAAPLTEHVCGPKDAPENLTLLPAT